MWCFIHDIKSMLVKFTPVNMLNKIEHYREISLCISRIVGVLEKVALEAWSVWKYWGLVCPYKKRRH